MALGPLADDAATANAWRATVRKRTILMAALLVAWTIGIEARLIYLQVFRHEALAKRAALQAEREQTVPGLRGSILDRDGVVMARNVPAASVYADPVELGATAGETIARLCRVLNGCDAARRDAMIAEIARLAAKNSRFLYLQRHVTSQEADKIRDLRLPGIGLRMESLRVYPKRELAAHVLGWVGEGDKGLGGIEGAYDSRIKGREGRLLLELDNKRRAVSRVEQPPTAGKTIELTLSVPLQHVAEEELRATVRGHDADGGTIIIADPYTGEILALANEPTFNPNVRLGGNLEDKVLRRNRAIQEIYEPGSTFKIVTASAAIEERAFTTGEPIDVSQGYIKLPGRIVKDVHTYGVLSFADVIVKSSNVGAIKIGNRLGPERMGRYVRRFGFGAVKCRDLGGASLGMLQSPANWSDNTLASISMGYEIGVTPVQMIAALSSVANGGHLIEPRLVRAFREGRRRDVVPPKELGRTIDPETIAELTTIMERVVAEGTGKQARIPGYTVAGKTGTAAKNFPGRGYSDSDYFASFVGFVPSRRPALAILVVIDTPRGPGYPKKHKYYGGDVAAPAFRRVAERALRYLAVPPSVDPRPPVLVTDIDATPAGAMTPVAAPASAPSVDAITGEPAVPELRGLGAREAIVRLAKLGLTAHVTGVGLVTAQDPPAGTPIDSRSTCRLTLGRPSPPPGVAPQ